MSFEDDMRALGNVPAMEESFSEDQAVGYAQRHLLGNQTAFEASSVSAVIERNLGDLLTPLKDEGRNMSIPEYLRFINPLLQRMNQFIFQIENLEVFVMDYDEKEDRKTFWKGEITTLKKLCDSISIWAYSKEDIDGWKAAQESEAPSLGEQLQSGIRIIYRHANSRKVGKTEEALVFCSARQNIIEVWERQRKIYKAAIRLPPPLRPKDVDPTLNEHNTLNTWTGFTNSRKILMAKARGWDMETWGRIAIFMNLIRYGMCECLEDYLAILFRWCSMLNAPGLRTELCNLFFGPEGCGKTLTAQYFGYLLGKENFAIVTNLDDILGFNAPAANKILVVVDELGLPADPKEQAKIRAQITGADQRIRFMHRDPKYHSNFCNYEFLHNPSTKARIYGDARRYQVFEAGIDHMLQDRRVIELIIGISADQDLPKDEIKGKFFANLVQVMQFEVGGVTGLDIFNAFLWLLPIQVTSPIQPHHGAVFRGYLHSGILQDTEVSYDYFWVYYCLYKKINYRNNGESKWEESIALHNLYALFDWWRGQQQRTTSTGKRKVDIAHDEKEFADAIRKLLPPSVVENNRIAGVVVWEKVVWEECCQAADRVYKGFSQWMKEGGTTFVDRKQSWWNQNFPPDMTDDQFIEQFMFGWIPRNWCSTGLEVGGKHYNIYNILLNDPGQLEELVRGIHTTIDPKTKSSTNSPNKRPAYFANLSQAAKAIKKGRA